VSSSEFDGSHLAVNAETVRALEAILMVAMEPVNPSLLAQLLEQSVDVVDELCEQLAAAYEQAGHGFQLVKIAGGYRLQSHPDVSSCVERFVLDSQEVRISSAALETLAIIAYKQPISRSQVSAIRGVDPDAVMRTLQARGYISEVGRDDGPGQAVMFGTTQLFLERLGLASIDKLPGISEFVPDASVVEALEMGLRIVPSASSVEPSPDSGN
jgi:segregation and condensation protein B